MSGNATTGDSEKDASVRTNQGHHDATERSEDNSSGPASTEVTPAVDRSSVFDDGSSPMNPLSSMIISNRDNTGMRSRSNSSEPDTHELGPPTPVHGFDTTTQAAFEVTPEWGDHKENPTDSTMSAHDPFSEVPSTMGDSMAAAAALRHQREIETRQLFAATSTPVGAVRVEYHRDDGDALAARLQDYSSTSSRSLHVVAYLADDENPDEIQTDDSDNSDTERHSYLRLRTRVTVLVLLIVLVGSLIGGVCGAGLCHTDSW